MGKTRTTGDRAQWGSNRGFIWAAAGSAVGLGTIWKFPGKAYAGGGGLYCLVYILVIILLGAVAMLGEFAVGRHTQRNCVAAFRSLRKGWGWVGLLGVLSSLIVLFYYVEVGGWVIRYIVGYVLEPDRNLLRPHYLFCYFDRGRRLFSLGWGSMVPIAVHTGHGSGHVGWGKRRNRKIQ